MAGVKISALPSISSPALADYYVTVDGGVTYKVTLNQILEQAQINTAVRLATTANLTATYNNGSSGIGATLVNAGALAALSIDGVTVVANNRVLIKNQSSSLQNGIYTVTTVGNGSTAWVLTRALDYDEASDVDAGDFFTVAFGTVNSKTQWIQTAVVSTMGTDAITFESNVVAGTGITKSTNTISLTNPVAMNLGGSGKALTAANGGIVYTDADSMEVLAPTATANQVLLSGSSAAPSWSTATFASTYAASSLLYSNGANTVIGLATANSSSLVTSSTGVPTWVGPLTTGQIIIGSTGATPTTATIKRGTTAAYGGGGTSNAFVATGLSGTDIVVASILTSTNSVSVNKVVPTADTLTITFSADPGAATTLNWIAFSP